LGRWWEPAAALTCTSLFTAFGVLQNLGDIFKISVPVLVVTWSYSNLPVR
jgi:hypothetical protein